MTGQILELDAAVMQSLSDCVAVVTGAGSGIGKGIALALAERGVDLVVADIDGAAAAETADGIAAIGRRAVTIELDVSDFEAMNALADRAYAEFGEVNVLCNNAGVGAFWPLLETTMADWRWMFSVNVDGVVNGLASFLPRMLQQEGGKHVVNTASMAGLIAVPGLVAYTATKHAVVGISETLRIEASPHGVGVSVLCPGPVRSRIDESQRNRPPHMGHVHESEPPPWDGSLAPLEPIEVGRMVCRAIECDEFYVITHPEMLPFIEERQGRLLAGFDAAARWREKSQTPMSRG